MIFGRPGSGKSTLIDILMGFLQPNSGEIKINGAAARKVQINDPVIIIAYGITSIEEAKNFQPKIILVDAKNIAIK
jgi:aspartate 1-decarboxylase